MKSEKSVKKERSSSVKLEEFKEGDLKQNEDKSEQTHKTKASKKSTKSARSGKSDKSNQEQHPREQFIVEKMVDYWKDHDK
jgi:hypothetical protein